MTTMDVLRRQVTAAEINPSSTEAIVAAPEDELIYHVEWQSALVATPQQRKGPFLGFTVS